jgi:hypothetical protein
MEKLLQYDISIKTVTLSINESMEIFIMLSYKNTKMQSKSHLVMNKVDSVVQFNESFSLLIGEVSGSVAIEVCSNKSEVKVLGSISVDIGLFEEVAKVINSIFNIHNLPKSEACGSGAIILEIKKHPAIHKEENNVQEIEELHKFESMVANKGKEVQGRIRISQGLTETIVVDLIKKGKEKDEIISLMKQRADEAILELERIKKNNESNESSLRNELVILKQNNETQKKEINNLSDKFLKAKYGNSSTQIHRMGIKRDAITSNS